jgi:hypothetical protein
MRAQSPLVWLPACHRHLDLGDPGGYTLLADRYAAAVPALVMRRRASTGTGCVRQISGKFAT